jgi:hypothetical protein
MGPLPVSKDWNGEYNAITVVIDILTRMVHLVPSRIDYMARDVVELVFSKVYKHHSLPQIIVSNQDTLFTSMFWAHLEYLIGIGQCLFSAYHLQMNRTTKCTN